MVLYSYYLVYTCVYLKCYLIYKKRMKYYFKSYYLLLLLYIYYSHLHFY